MKKKLMVLLCLSLFLFSCQTPSDEQREPVTFSVLYNQAQDSPVKEDWLILEEYQKNQNVTLDIQTADDGDYENETIKIFDSGQIPDIVLKIYPGTIDTYAAKGILLPFSDYEDLMPNYTAYIKEKGLESEVDKLRLPNGKYYILPGYQREIQVQQWIYRQDLFEKHSLAAPTTYDELFDTLVTLKEIYPDSTPITASWGGAHLFAMMGAGYEIPAGWNGTRFYDEADGLWKYAPADENYREFLRFLNRCYEAGVLDPAIFTQSDTDFLDKLVDGRAFVTVTWITSGFSNWNTMLADNGIAGGAWVPLPVPESTIGVRALPAVNPFRKGLVVPASVANKPYFEDLIAFLDWAVYSEEGMTLTTWGVEGVTFEAKDGSKVFLPEISTPKNPEGTINITPEYGLDTLFNLNENEAFEDYKKPPEIVAFLERSLLAGETARMDPELKMDAQSLESVRMIEDTLSSYTAESMQAFITGNLQIDTDWEAYLTELETRGVRTIEEIWNSVWEDQSQ